MRGEDRFGMKLDTPYGQLPVAEAHDFPLRCLSGDLKAIGKCFPPYKQTMVAGSLEGIWKTLEQILAVMKNRRGLAMHQPFGPDNFSTVDIPHALMTETNTQDGISPGELLDHLTTDSCLLRSAGARGNADPIG